MSANRERAYGGSARLSDGDTVLDHDQPAGRRDRYRHRRNAVLWTVLVFGAVVSAVVLASAGR